jgi:hypothetical protein
LFKWCMHRKDERLCLMNTKWRMNEKLKQESLDGRLCELQGMKHLKILFALPIFSDGMMLFDGLYI